MTWGPLFPRDRPAVARSSSEAALSWRTLGCSDTSPHRRTMDPESSPGASEERKVPVNISGQHIEDYFATVSHGVYPVNAKGCPPKAPPADVSSCCVRSAHDTPHGVPPDLHPRRGPGEGQCSIRAVENGHSAMPSGVRLLAMRTARRRRRPQASTVRGRGIRPIPAARHACLEAIGIQIQYHIMPRASRCGFHPVKTNSWIKCNGELTADRMAGNARYFGTAPIFWMSRRTQRAQRGSDLLFE
jgi:hypothetical protein